MHKLCLLNIYLYILVIYINIFLSKIKLGNYITILLFYSNSFIAFLLFFDWPDMAIFMQKSEIKVSSQEEKKWRVFELGLGVLKNSNG